MKEELISFETAKLAKEKGFDIVSKIYYKVVQPTPEDLNVTLVNGNIESNWNFRSNAGIYLAPTQSLLQKWLREVHKIYMWVERYNEDERFFYQCPKLHKLNLKLNHWGDSYEEALEKGLQEALKLINK